MADMHENIVVDKIEVNEIRAKRVVVRSGDCHVTIEGSDSGVGVWLTDGKTRAQVCICAGFDQGAQVSVRRGNSPVDAAGHDLSMSADDQSAAVQIVNDKRYKQISVAKLFALIDGIEPAVME